MYQFILAYIGKDCHVEHGNIQKYGKNIELDGEHYTIKAKVHTLLGISGSITKVPESLLN